MSDPRFEVLHGPSRLPGTLSVEDLSQVYAWPLTASVRANFIATLDGTVTGPDGLSGSLGNAADRVVFQLLRATCDAIVVGAGTARAEQYGPPPAGTLLVVVSRRGVLPTQLATCPDVVLATTTTAGSEVDRHCELLGPDRVWVVGESEVSAQGLRARLLDNGRRRILHEGGPTLFTQWLRASCIDELCLTTVPRLGLAGQEMVHPEQRGIDLQLHSLLRSAEVLLGRWVVRPADDGV